MKNSLHFDYIIIGNGLAGLQLALKLNSDAFFKDKRIALIDPSPKNTNDKTWSFWESGDSQWDAIIYKSWQHASIYTSEKSINLKLAPYQYKTIKALDFYNHAKNQLSKNKNIQSFLDEVLQVEENNSNVLVRTKHSSLTASHIFDSRIPDDFSLPNKNYITLIQHFKGYILKTETPTFKTDNLTMMDYRLKDGEQTTFTYVLPFSATEALVEFTYFTENTVKNSVYDDFLNTYINTFLNIENYKIIEVEKGQIPMSNFPFEKHNTKRITKIGTAGGWVKASTGYSFKNTEKKVAKIIENIKVNNIPSRNLFSSKYKFYDTIFLKVLKDENHKGEWIFQQFYSKNSVQTMFKFLDEESSFLDELKIMCSLFSWSFIKAFFKTL